MIKFEKPRVFRKLDRNYTKLNYLPDRRARFQLRTVGLVKDLLITTNSLITISLFYFISQ